jgi:hypothetical protein
MMAQATMNGQLVDDGGLVCDVRFEWGSSTNYEFATPWVGGYTFGMTFSYTLYNLAEGVPYHYRAVAKNRNGVSYGKDEVIHTLIERGIGVLIDDATLVRLLEVG